MKKRMMIILIVLVSLILIVSWVTKVEKFNYHYPETITIKKNVDIWGCYELQEYKPLEITDEEQIKSIIKNLNKVIHIDTRTEYEFCKSDYLINLGDQGSISITKSNGKYYLGSSRKVIIGNFDFLDELHFEEKNE